MRGVDAIGGEVDREILLAQRARDRRPQIAVVLDQQDTHRAPSFLRRALCRSLKPKLNDPVQRGWQGARLNIAHQPEEE
ncbi:hypothetical protein GCM10022253_22520 [Sphingomonas endophytica]